MNELEHADESSLIKTVPGRGRFFVFFVNKSNKGYRCSFIFIILLQSLLFCNKA